MKSPARRPHRLAVRPPARRRSVPSTAYPSFNRWTSRHWTSRHWTIHDWTTRRRAALIVAPAVIALALLALAAWQLTADLPGPGTLITRAAPDTTKIYDRRGTLLFEVLDPRAGRRTRVRLADLPPQLLQAVIAVEDAGFYTHPGVDARGLARAMVQMARERRIVSGGSTITQQLARELLLSQDERAERSVRRKLREMILALRITAAYSKDDILEMYMSEVYFGQLAYGVEAAAQTYFGKPARELDLAESALLAGLIQSPAAYNPLVNIDAARARQAVVLGLMARAGFITADEGKIAQAEQLRFMPGDGLLLAPHFVTWVRSRLESEYGAERVNRGGLHVVTTLDLDLQRRAEAIVKKRMAELGRREPGKPDYSATDAALVAIDPATGQVIAMVGSADYADASIDGAVNVALALRQPGSSFKPITYATAFDADRWGTAGATHRDQGSAPALPFAPATVISDVPTSFLTKENEPYRPQNYDRMWHGPINLRRALATSSNMVAVKVLDAVGVDAAIDTAEALGITSLASRERYGLALTLGGGDVRLIELTAAFGAFANGGHRVTPDPILAVLDAEEWRAASAADGAGLAGLADKRTVGRAQAISPRVAFLVTDILSDDQARLPAFGEGSVLALARPAAAKTGTTTDFRDNWTVGYTPDLVTGVWLGNADNRPMQFISGITGAGPIWHDFMEEAHRGRPARAFDRPDGLVQVEVCATSGLLPTEHCRRRAREWFIAGTEPTAYDTSYQAIDIDLATGRGWSERCQGRRATRVFRILPPDAADWGRQNGIPEPPRETCAGEAFPPTARMARDHPSEVTNHPLSRVFRERGTGGEGGLRNEPPLSITHPAPNTTFALSPQIPRSLQRIELAAQVGADLDQPEVTLLVDDTPIATLRRPPYRANWTLETGSHSVRAVAVARDGRREESETVTFGVVEEVAQLTQP